jgi:hypothetical protein
MKKGGRSRGGKGREKRQGIGKEKEKERVSLPPHLDFPASQVKLAGSQVPKRPRKCSLQTSSPVMIQENYGIILKILFCLGWGSFMKSYTITSCYYKVLFKSQWPCQAITVRPIFSLN